MLTEDLRTKTEDELKKELLDLRKKQFNLRFQLTSGQLENTSQFSVVRKDIARVKTVLRQKDLGLEIVAKPKAKKTASKKTEAKKDTVKKDAAKKDTAKKPSKNIESKKSTPKKDAAKKASPKAAPKDQTANKSTGKNVTTKAPVAQKQDKK